MLLASIEFPKSNDTPIRRSVRRLRWFKKAFAAQVDILSSETGVEFELDEQKLRGLFLCWIKSFEEQRPHEAGLRQEYVSFASGLMLRELIRAKPLLATKIPENADRSNPAYFWPEGYAYVAFCLNVRYAVLEQDFDIKRDISANFENIGTWWSFKENVVEDPSLAIGFFDLFTGVYPNWNMPSFFSQRHIEKTALKFCRRQSDKILPKDQG